MKVPEEIKKIAKVLQSNGFSAYLVGGCMRDLLLGREPKDWDIATNAKPEEIQKIFSTFAGATADKPATIYENQFGTVGVKTGSDNPALKIVEITTFRLEGKYTDMRHPDEVKFAKTIEEDLSRRDFTINAIAFNIGTSDVQKIDGNIRTSDVQNIIDPYGGQKDLENKIIRTVGDSSQRFNEDALRLLRAVRFGAELGFSAQGGPASGWKIESGTAASIKKEAGLLEMIAKERIRDEFEKMIMSFGSGPSEGIRQLEELGLLKYIMPELVEGVGVGQNKHHIYTVFEHNVRALDYAAKQNYSFEVRMASLLHDVGKPRVKNGDGPDSTFYAHEIVGGKMALAILDRLRFSKEAVLKISHLVRYHLFYYNVGEVTEAGVRRFLSRVGPENVDDLIKVREADRIGSGVPKAVPYKLRHLLFMIEKVKRDPISPKMLAVKGEDVMRIAGIQPGPKVGWILGILLEEVLDDPKKNIIENLEIIIKNLAKLPDEELKNLSKKAREKKDEFEGGIEEEIKKKYYVK
ncbi:MAG: CCA tRNA nucleotidyltransferase [Candidatus Brennerbacteria bacterium]|nr:CCA tRNA nucleotidyltransferase [Candidatus Brennerbacteria bacterium]